MSELPRKYHHREREPYWRDRWEEWGIYRWDPSRPREETFVVDSPPPTVSGSLHVGHVFSYTHQDLLVRYQRMRGRNICYPMGWDDNGLPTERRVQNVFALRCNPRLPYDPAWKPRRNRDPEEVEEVSRRNFIEACALVTREDEAAFEALWRRLGLSVDWSLQYATIDDHCRRISQLSFLDMVEKGMVYRTESPTMWDVDFQTAVAQAEVEDRQIPGMYHDVRFEVEGGGDFVISTTRPELLPACIAVVAHPEDERYRPLFGKRAVTPLFGARVPILPDRQADPEKGTGILMVCTFGDAMDVEFWKRSGLPLRQVVGRDGRLLPVEFGEQPFDSRHPEAARTRYGRLLGRTVKEARVLVARMLAEEGSLVGEPRSTVHPVRFYEKGERPLEYISTWQWFVRILDHKQELLEKSRRIRWHPEHMRSRIEHWIEGLTVDWCISRQRFFGVPFPVWYPLDAQGHPHPERPLYAPPDMLPVDPLSQPPPGYREEQRDCPGGFTGDPDVMDTWATSSLTPQIVSHWSLDPERHRKLFPMDIRPQSHEIIRTWAFYTIVKAWIHEDTVPWNHVVISGWILDPDRKKMSKSRGNVETPAEYLEHHSADAVRYWAARARLGMDTVFDPELFKLGKRLATKVFNASRFVLMQLERAGATPPPSAISEPLDRAYVERLRGVVESATRCFERFDYAGALQATEEAFWEFCDDYLELVKVRSYQEEDSPARRSAHATLRYALGVFLRLFAPVLPFVTEEVWSWRFARETGTRSLHLVAWPSPSEVECVPPPPEPALYECAREVLSKIRQAKTCARRNLRWPVSRLVVAGSDSDRRALGAALADVVNAGAVEPQAVEFREGAAPEGERFTVKAELAPEEAVQSGR